MEIDLRASVSEDLRSSPAFSRETSAVEDVVKTPNQQPSQQQEDDRTGDNIDGMPAKAKWTSQQPVDRGSPPNLIGVQLGVPDGTEVIDWAAAIDQCSGDESFLEELLVDLWNESNAHMQQLRDFVPRGDMLETQHEAHSIKGAAANLMCHRLRLAALYLERAGQVGTRLQEGSSDFSSLKEDLETGMQVLEKELVLFQDLLKQKKLV
ncbi:unnamed protein product [Scytosiphon promiscuus]